VENAAFGGRGCGGGDRARHWRPSEQERSAQDHPIRINPVPQYDEAGKRVAALALASKDGEFPVVAQKKGLVAFAYDGRIVWVDEFDVKLSRSKDSGITCVHRGGGLSAGPNLKPLTDIGAGEDC
jgi:hypothetical protein